MHQHHADSIERLLDMFRDREDVIAVILGGSVAKGIERPDPDIDAMVVLTDVPAASDPPRVRSECVFGRCTYPEGYFDLKYYTKDYLEKAALHGSEPTRNAFLGSRCLSTKDPGIPELLARIARYPEDERQDKILSFLSSFALNKDYFWGEATRAGDPYLLARTTADIVLFGLRLLLAHNRILFPCHKRLLETAERCPLRPDGVIDLARALLFAPTDGNKEAFVSAILGFSDWGDILARDYDATISRFIDDNELWWYETRPVLAEW